MTNEKEFKIRAYGFGELALLYSPNSTQKSANDKLYRWIKIKKSLSNALINEGFYPGLRNLTPRMVEIIVEGIGVP